MLVRSLLQFFLLIGLALAPICGMGGAATAMPTAEQATEHRVVAADRGHCAKTDAQQEDETQSDADFDCRVGCAGVLAATPTLAETSVVASINRSIAVAASAAGLTPAAEPRPPRLS
jgi:hypothetical protein